MITIECGKFAQIITGKRPIEIGFDRLMISLIERFKCINRLCD